MAVLRREEVERRASEMAAEVCGRLGLRFVDCRYRKRDGQWLLLVRIDKQTGVSVDDCAQVSRVLGDRLDEADPIEHGYTLEVSSLGLSGPLKTDEDLRRFVGRPVELLLSPERGRSGNKRNGKSVAAGRLVAFDGASFTLEADEGRLVRIDRGRVQRARPAVYFGDMGERQR